MSVIRVHVEDQVLRIIEAPTIASGGQNEVKVAFTFCEKWDGFSKTATFQQGDGDVYYAVLNEDDVCVIPWEVCYDVGTFYVGVFGEKDNVRRTTTVVKYKVQRGSIGNESVPSAPSLEVYDQIMSAFADAKAEQEHFVSEVNTVMTASVEAVNQTNDNVNRFVQEMTKAKENGEFKGEKGEPGKDGTPGKDGANGVDGKNGTNGKDGADGKDGYTPVKGVDYYTEADKTAFQTYLRTLLGENIVPLTQAEYDALGDAVDPNKYYMIVGDGE